MIALQYLVLLVVFFGAVQYDGRKYLVPLTRTLVGLNPGTSRSTLPDPVMFVVTEEGFPLYNRLLLPETTAAKAWPTKMSAIPDPWSIQKMSATGIQRS